MKIVITGGHHTPAIPVIEKLRQKNPDIKIYWFGHKHTLKGSKEPTLEYKEIRALNIPFYNLQAGKLYKTYDPIRLLKIPFGILHAFVLLTWLRPKVLLSFGGYLAAPTVLAAKILRIPSVTHEQTVVAGYANKLIAKLADKILISWPDSAKYFPPKKTQLVGLPVRKEIFTVKSDTFEVNKELPTIYVTAGKTGSHKINQAVSGCLGTLLTKCNIIHQCGAHSKFNDIRVLNVKYKDLNPKPQGAYFVKEFIELDEIGEVFKKADLIVSRSGASITAEILVLEKPAILIPIPWVSHNEQLENAKIIKNAGLGVILEENQLSPKTLKNMVFHALNNLDKMKLRDASYKSLLKDDSADLIVASVAPYLEK